MAPRLILALAVTLLLAAGAALRTAAEEQKIPSSIEWLEEIQTAPRPLPADAPRLKPLVSDPITREDWSKQREAIRDRWLKFLGPLATAQRPKVKLTVLKEQQVDGVVRQLVEYEAEPGEKTQAYLLKPAKLEGKAPGIVVFHSTVDHSIHQPAGVEGAAEKAFGLKLAQRGYVTFCPRNFLWPTNDKIDAKAQVAAFGQRHPDSKGMAKMLYDALLAVDILAAQPEVDASRIGAVGHSLGAKEVLYLAAFDKRVKVTVSSEGGIGTRFSNWDAPWYLGPAIREDSFGMEQHELLALAAPRAFLLIGGDSADGDRGWPFIEAALPVYRLYEEAPHVGQYNHRKGHAVPPEAEARIYEWFEALLPP